MKLANIIPVIFLHYTAARTLKSGQLVGFSPSPDVNCFNAKYGEWLAISHNKVTFNTCPGTNAYWGALGTYMPAARRILENRRCTNEAFYIYGEGKQFDEEITENDLVRFERYAIDLVDNISPSRMWLAVGNRNNEMLSFDDCPVRSFAGNRQGYEDLGENDQHAFGPNASDCPNNNFVIEPINKRSDGKIDENSNVVIRSVGNNDSCDGGRYALNFNGKVVKTGADSGCNNNRHQYQAKCETWRLNLIWAW